VTHRNSVTDTDHPELKWHTSCSRYAFPYLLGNLPQMNMAGNNVIKCIGNPNEREFHLAVRYSE
jgi:hypothetical protein